MLLWIDGFENYGPAGVSVTDAMSSAGYTMVAPFSEDPLPTPSTITRRGIGLSLMPNTRAYNAGVARTIPATAQLFTGFAVCMSQPISAGGYTIVAQFLTASTGEFSNRATLTLNADGSLSLADGDTQQVGPSAPNVIQTGLWYFVEVCLDSTNSIVTVRVDSQTILQETFTYPAVTSLQLDPSSNSSGVPRGMSLAYDDFYICDSTGTAFNTFLGDVVVHTVLPGAPGYLSNTDSVAGAAEAWQALGKNGPGGSTYGFTTGSTINDTVLFAPETLPIDFIDVLAVQLAVQVPGNVTGAAPFQLAMVQNATQPLFGIAPVGDPTPNLDNTPTANTILTTIVTVMPLGGPWTTPNAQQAQFGVYFPAVQPQAFSQVYVNMLATYSPDYGFTDVILPDVFPYDISYDSVGSTRWATDVIVVDSGADQRIQRWSQPLMEYDVAYGVRTMEQLVGLISFFRAMKGRLNAFNYLDNVDCTSSIPTAYESRAAPALTAFDQPIATGDGQTITFQLTKTYSSQTQTQVRPIFRPVPGTVLVGVNGMVVTNFTVDDQGNVNFTSPLTVNVAHSVTKGAPNGANVAIYTGEAGDFAALGAYIEQGYTVGVAGFATSSSNLPANVNGGTVYAVSGDSSTVSIQYPHGVSNGTDTAASLTLTISPAPPPGFAITAGYQFYVPVRFDTDSLPITIQDYGVGGSNSVKLIEVRPSSW